MAKVKNRKYKKDEFVFCFPAKADVLSVSADGAARFTWFFLVYVGKLTDLRKHYSGPRQ